MIQGYVGLNIFLNINYTQAFKLWAVLCFTYLIFEAEGPKSRWWILWHDILGFVSVLSYHMMPNVRPILYTKDRVLYEQFDNAIQFLIVWSLLFKGFCIQSPPLVIGDDIMNNRKGGIIHSFFVKSTQFLQRMFKKQNKKITISNTSYLLRSQANSSNSYWKRLTSRSIENANLGPSTKNFPAGITTCS